MKLKELVPWKKSYLQPRQHIKKQRHYFANKCPSCQSYGFSCRQCMDVRVGPQRKLSIEELMFWTVVLEKTLESPLDCKEIQLFNPKGNQSWIFIGRTDAEVEISILWTGSVLWWNGITDSIHVSLSKLWVLVMDRKPQFIGLQKSWTILSNWTKEWKIKNIFS